MTCKDPGEITHGKRIPLKGPYPCGTSVTYTCEDGYEMQGNGTLLCGEQGLFIFSLLHCSPTDMRNTDESKVESEDIFEKKIFMEIDQLPLP